MDASIIQSARHCTFFSIVLVGVYLYEDPPSLWKVRDISKKKVLVGYQAEKNFSENGSFTGQDGQVRAGV